jgi:uncharacterized phage protein gp47/JayE
MYEDKTAEALLDAMLENAPDDVDKREGSVVYDLLAPAAIEFSLAYTELDTLLLLGFADTTEGEWLDKCVATFGLTRKPAVKATGQVTFTGPEGTVIPAGTRLVTGGVEPIYFVTIAEATITGGTATVSAEAEEGGAKGNVAAGEITSLAVGESLFGVVSVTNPQPFDGGADEESDDDLRARFFDRVRRPATSGNANHYRQWALEVPGVGDAKVYPVANGPKTVKVVLLDTEKTAPAQSIIDAVAAHIEEERPINADVEVVGATEVPINISATLTLAAGKTLADAQTEIEAAVTDYLKSLAFVDPIVRYSKIASLILDAPSVIDYANLTVNGGTSNITIADDSVAVLGTVTLS